ncbi:cupin domain-containing protein [Patescibacteria group bacterium]|nr:cupin domain-containing protein [Patescibacteria group bacterium]
MDENKLKNGKYFIGRYSEFENRKGWFIGSFFDEGHPCKTDKVEVQFKEQKAGHVCPSHYHQKKVEILLILEGRAFFTINKDRVEVKTGDFLFIDTNNITLGEFVEDTIYFTIHAPSIPDDKVKVDPKTPFSQQINH